MLGETDVDALIADRLSGQTPFVSTDLFPAFDEDIIPETGAGVEQGMPGVSRVTLETQVGSSVPLEPTTAGVLHGPDAARGDAARMAAPVFDLGAPVDIGFLNRPTGSTEPSLADTTEAVEIDLSNLLEELRPSMAEAKLPRKDSGRDLETVFKDFRDEVSRENVADAAAQHYKLAIAYLDMGMIEDALKALQVSVRAPRLRFESASMLARIYLKQNAPTQAVEWFERAAEAPAPNPDAGRALLYELAETLESQGETARALAVFLELQADAGDYRDVSARLERLTRVQMRG
jgi:tetratricopeptide (TPR) repeat protein